VSASLRSRAIPCAPSQLESTRVGALLAPGYNLRFMEAPTQISRTLWAALLKRPFDAFTAAAALLVLSPLLGVIALFIKLTSPGPVFFRQQRAGLDNQVFRPFKFRTMRSDRTPDVKELVPLVHPDITPVGRLLRRFKLDELPQLINVLIGDMSLVGPRPTLRDQTLRYTAFQAQRLLVRPGITGLAQVNSSAEQPWNERICYDVAYVRRCSFVLDIKVLIKTPLTMLFGEHRTARPFAQSRYAGWVTPPLQKDMPDPVTGHP